MPGQNITRERRKLSVTYNGRVITWQEEEMSGNDVPDRFGPTLLLHIPLS
jgi:hypothetical protein